AYFNLTSLTQAQEDDGEMINISGKQRMYSQKIALYSLTDRVDELSVLITLMRDSHKFLVSKDMSSEFKKIYFSDPINLDKMIKNYLKHAENFVKTKDKDSLEYILQNSEKLLKELDYATSTYQDVSDVRVENLQNRELYILILTLITLLFVALFIFAPANKSMQRKTKELLSQKNYLDVITNINTNAIIAVDQTFNILTFNKSAEEMFGYTAEEMLHTKLLDDRIIPTKYLEAHNKGIANFMKSGKLKNKDVVFELTGQNKNKESFPMRISFGISVENDKKIVVANIQNITKDKEKDDLILQQSRFAAMGEMIGNIAHQWRQPLSSISAMATGAKLRYKNNLITYRSCLFR
ncbi:MAG: PAS domain S-box protein, partial [Campylobacterota bacterium]|nr:PAS domain S-box protein [Campylobacterota bacterium]